MRQRSKTLPLWALFDCLGRRGQGGRPGCPHTWRFGLPICTPRKLIPYPPPHSSPPCGLRTCRTAPPPPRSGTVGGGGSYGKSGVASSTRTAPPPPFAPSLCPAPPRPQEELGFVTVDSNDSSGSDPKEGGGGGRVCTGGVQPAFALGVRTRPPASRSKFQGRRREGGSTENRPAKGRCLAFKREAGPLEWWAIPCV